MCQVASAESRSCELVILCTRVGKKIQSYRAYKGAVPLLRQTGMLPTFLLNVSGWEIRRNMSH